MLVLSRKVGEKIQIGEDITVTVLKRKGSRVWIGIEAPGQYRILRAELPTEPGPEDAPETQCDRPTAKVA